MRYQLTIRVGDYRIIYTVFDNLLTIDVIAPAIEKIFMNRRIEKKTFMARNEKLEIKVREALAGTPNVEENFLFRGTAFMVAGKLCISAGNEELMFRIDPALHETVIEKDGCREMLRNGNAIKGYVYVHESCVETKQDLNYWVRLALEYNGCAKATPKKAKR